ncbi:MAG TPA: thioredoxin family protein, partial [Vicinamibacterales bacterium]|nr:thioredoxin family protein [Vicinamibacterales bacterium]
MAFLSPANQQTLRDTLGRMVQPVKALLFTQAIGCETCAETRQILRELTAATDRLTIEELNPVLDRERAAQYGIDRAPAIVLLTEDGSDSRVRFLGAPAGSDFSAFVDAVLLVSGGSSQQLSEATRGRLAGLTEPLDLRVFVTPTCGYCPRAVALVNRLAFASSLITATTVQATEFPDLARAYRVSGVPKTVGSNGREVLGALPEARFVSELLGDEGTAAAGA